MATIIHAGKYARVMLTCHDLETEHIRKNTRIWKEDATDMIQGESPRPITFI
jgi:hypothetical protein